MASIELTKTFSNDNSSQKKEAESERSEYAETETNGQKIGDQTSDNATTIKTNLNGNASDVYTNGESLKILGHIKHIEKINENRRVFLSNTLSESLTTSETTATSNEKTEFSTKEKIISTTSCNEKIEAKTDAAVKSEKRNQNDNQENADSIVQETYVAKSSDERRTKYATQTASLPPIKSPLTPPPKPPMLSRTRSLGVGDQRVSTTSVKSAPQTPANTPCTPVKESSQQSPSDSLPITTATVTSEILASPVKLSTTEKTESAPVLRRTERPMSILSENNDQSKISVNHYERLVEELKCPGCASPMKAPIMLCKTGHSICSQCTRILLMCPLCKETFTNTRSRTVEALCHKAHFRCCYASGGCTVRLQTDLLSWHEKQCIYKPMKCFMGRVWGDCQWSGREIFWKDHLEAEHGDRVFKSHDSDLIWNMGMKQKPLAGYYVFDIYDELFNFYEIYDKDRLLFTMTCTSTVRERKHNFAYEVTIIHQNNEALAITQKFPVHSEYDKDILKDGTCVSISLNDLAKFIDDDKFLHYRVRILEIKSPRKLKPPRFVAAPNNGMHPVDFQQTQIEGANLKGIPSESIVTRKIDEIPFVDNTITPSSNGTEIEAGAVGLGDEDIQLRQRYYGNERIIRDSSSESDPELEAYIAKKWGTPQLHFNRKYLKEVSVDSSSSAGEVADKLDDRMSVCSKSTSYTKKMTNSLRKSFRSLKAPIVELKPLSFVKKSPEKKSP